MKNTLNRRNLLRVRAQSDRGSALVEIALSMALLLTALFGVFAFGLGGYSYFYISNAAREATRYAIVRGSSHTKDCTTPGIADCVAQTGDIQTYVRGLSLPGIQSSNVNVATTYLTNTGGACGTSNLCKVPGGLVQSTVSYSLPLFIPFVPQKTMNITSTSQMVISY